MPEYGGDIPSRRWGAINCTCVKVRRFIVFSIVVLFETSLRAGSLSKPFMLKKPGRVADSGQGPSQVRFAGRCLFRLNAGMKMLSMIIAAVSVRSTLPACALITLRDGLLLEPSVAMTPDGHYYFHNSINLRCWGVA
jgi:hypothetical protein